MFKALILLSVLWTISCEPKKDDKESDNSSVATASSSEQANTGEVEEVVSLVGFFLNDGAEQHSHISSVTIELEDASANVDLSQFFVTEKSSGDKVPSDARLFESNGTTFVEISFRQSAYVDATGSLVDGLYEVHPKQDVSLSLNSDSTLQQFHRLLGDFNGDASVNYVDYDQFTVGYGLPKDHSNFDILLDLNRDNVINFDDFNLLSSRFGHSYDNTEKSIFADLDDDGSFDASEQTLFLNAWMSTSSDPEFMVEFDSNNDQVIDSEDYEYLRVTYSGLIIAGIPVPGDKGGNGVVGVDDFGQFRSAFGSSSSDPHYDAFFDFDSDGDVDDEDNLRFEIAFNGGTLNEPDSNYGDFDDNGAALDATDLFLFSFVYDDQASYDITPYDINGDGVLDSVEVNAIQALIDDATWQP